MSKWTHSICEACWNQRNPLRTVYRVVVEKGEPCCFCGKPHQSGIYVRADQVDLLCQGKGTVHDEDGA